MPERPSKVDAHTDPSVTKQYDNKTSTADKFKDFYALSENIKTCMFSTYRPGVGVSSPNTSPHPNLILLLSLQHKTF